MDFLSSEKISCPGCSQSTLANGKTLYRRIAVTPVLVAPDQNSVVTLAPQFARSQSGHAKQDCELATSRRWFGKAEDREREQQYPQNQGLSL